MNESERKIKLSPETEELINPKTQDKAIKEFERIENLRKKHEIEKKELLSDISSAADKNVQLGNEKSEVETKLAKADNENRALKEALSLAKQKYSTLTEPEERMSYGDRVSKGAYELIKKRCKMGYYGENPCRECKSSL